MSCSSDTRSVAQFCSNTWQKERHTDELAPCFSWLCPSGEDGSGNKSTACQMTLRPCCPRPHTSSCSTAVLMKSFPSPMFGTISNDCPRQRFACSMGRSILSLMGCLSLSRTSSGCNTRLCVTVRLWQRYFHSVSPISHELARLPHNKGYTVVQPPKGRSTSR